MGSRRSAQHAGLGTEDPDGSLASCPGASWARKLLEAPDGHPADLRPQSSEGSF